MRNIYRLTLNEKLILNKKFYLGLGILFFVVSGFPLIIFVNELIAHKGALKAYNQLLIIGNYFLSLGYLGAAICSKKEI